MTKKILSLFITISILILSSCGGTSPSILTPATIHADGGFPPAQPLTCTGQPNVDGGQHCVESDGVNFYRDSAFKVGIRPDGHGTFGIATEIGSHNPTGLKEVTFNFPQTINISEIHGTLSIQAFCDGFGVGTQFDGAVHGGPIEALTAGKTYLLKKGDQANFPFPQVVFPTTVPVVELYLYDFRDLGCGTVHWTLNGSF